MAWVHERVIWQREELGVDAMVQQLSIACAWQKQQD
jgi:hypothetical protein